MKWLLLFADVAIEIAYAYLEIWCRRYLNIFMIWGVYASKNDTFWNKLLEGRVLENIQD
jgi:hypothetical protein